MSYLNVLTGGTVVNCDAVQGENGVYSELIIMNKDNWFNQGELRSDNTSNLDATGKADFENFTSAYADKSYTFNGIDKHVKVTTTGSARSNGTSGFTHKVDFIIFSNDLNARKVVNELANSDLIAVVRNKQTDLYEALGLTVGLHMNGLNRTYNDPEKGNFYMVTLQTNSKGGKEARLPYTFVNLT